MHKTDKTGCLAIVFFNASNFHIEKLSNDLTHTRSVCHSIDRIWWG